MTITKTSTRVPLGKGEVRYMGYRPELEATIFAVSDTTGRSPMHTERLLRAAHTMEAEIALLADLIEAFYGGKTSAMSEVERFALKRARALLATIENGETV